MEMNEFEKAMAGVHAIAKSARKQERELNEKNRRAEHERYEQRMREITEAHKKAVAETIAAYRQPTPTEKRRRAIAYRLQVALKALVQEWGGKDVYDYKAASCNFQQTTNEEEITGMAFYVFVPYKEPEVAE